MKVDNLQYLKRLIASHKKIQKINFREYLFPPAPPGTLPARGDEIFSLSRKEFLYSDTLEKIINNLLKNRNIGIESRLETSSGDLHIPMMDFLISKSSSNLNKIKQVFGKNIKSNFGSGTIFETDNSYHFIGDKLFSYDRFTEFMCWSLLAVDQKGKKYINLVDVQYVAYCLLKKSACIRVSPYPNKQTIPLSVARI